MGSGAGGLYKGAAPLIDPAHIDELKKKGVKFTEKNVVMTAKDQKGNLMWLETGNDNAGLKHLLQGNGKTPGHANDFKKAFGVSPDQVPSLMKSIISSGTLVSNKQRLLPNGNIGIERIYSVDGKHYLLTSVGTNGFIVTAYPVELNLQ